MAAIDTRPMSSPHGPGRSSGAHRDPHPTTPGSTSYWRYASARGWEVGWVAAVMLRAVAEGMAADRQRLGTLSIPDSADPASHAASHGGHTGHHGVDQVAGARAINLRKLPLHHAMDGRQADFSSSCPGETQGP